MNIFRSEEIRFYNLVIPGESAWEILDQLGELSSLHFVNPQEQQGISNYAKPFAKQIKRCEEVLAKVH